MFSHSMEEEKKGWDEAHCAYRCADDTMVVTKRRENRVFYREKWSNLTRGVLVAGMVYNRGITDFSWRRNLPRIITFPPSIRTLD